MDMRHLEYLRAVTDEDVREIKRKEDTYKGSWKKRGGVGAFMMLARKWDRIEEMCKRRHFDILEQVGDGNDGSLIAEIRDLRRYATLIESELMASGKIEISSYSRYSDFVSVAATGGSVFVDSESGPKPNPEEGSQHESLYPWVVNSERARLFHSYYRRVGENRYALEPFVEVMVIMPTSLADFYEQNEHGSTVRLDLCPSGAREYFPDLQEEVNHYELTKLPKWQQVLYEWHETEDKYRVRDRVWLSESEREAA